MFFLHKLHLGIFGFDPSDAAALDTEISSSSRALDLIEISRGTLSEANCRSGGSFGLAISTGFGRLKTLGSLRISRLSKLAPTKNEKNSYLKVPRTGNCFSRRGLVVFLIGAVFWRFSGGGDIRGGARDFVL
jgi:hypothetical protein